MPILELNAGKSAKRAVLLITGFTAIFGLLFGLPPAYAVCELGFAFLPYGAAAILMALVVGLLLAFVVVTFVIDLPVAHLLRVAEVPVATGPRPSLPTEQPKPRKCPPSALRSRLADEKARLDRFEEEREKRHDPRFAKMTEQRIIWCELLDLELQDVDEQMSRICRGEDGAENRQEHG